MSKQIQTLTSENIYDVHKQNVEKYFEIAETTVPQYFQSLTSVQAEWYQICKNTIISTISLQQEFAKKTGISSELSESVKNVIVDTSKQINNVKDVQNQIVQTITKSIQQTLRTLNDNTSGFADLNGNILHSWISTFMQKRN